MRSNNIDEDVQPAQQFLSRITFIHIENAKTLL